MFPEGFPFFSLLRPTAAGSGTHTCLETYRGIVCLVLSREDKGQHACLFAKLRITRLVYIAKQLCPTSHIFRLLIKRLRRMICRQSIRFTLMNFIVFPQIVNLILGEQLEMANFRHRLHAHTVRINIHVYLQNITFHIIKAPGELDIIDQG